VTSVRSVEPAKDQTAIVIGGGVIGCSTAYFLARDGWHVRVLDGGRIGGGCSHGNCGFICPSHVLPLTMPGALWPALRTIFRRDSPVYVRPRWDPALWAWLGRFAWCSRREPMMRAAAARHALLGSSMKLYRELVADEKLDIEWDERGLLLVFKSPHHFDAYRQLANFIHAEFGIAATRLDSAQLVKVEPALRPDMAGAWHYACDAHLRPDRLMMELASVLALGGVELVPETRVVGIHVDKRRATSIDTSRGSMSADTIVLAAGAETPELAAQLGFHIPIQPGKGYSITLPRPRTAPTTPMIFEEYHVAVTPWSSGLRIGSTMEFVGYDRSINRRRIDLFKRAAAEYLVEPPTGPVEEEWCGWRPMTYDDLPCIGRTPRVQNVVVAAGHGMIGMATAMSTGKLAAEIVARAQPHIDPAPYSLERFGA
jgi:D-amino-acid dehydrogenase